VLWFTGVKVSAQWVMTARPTAISAAPNQQVGFYLRNDGGSAGEVTQFTLNFRIDADGPSIAAVDMVTGTPFEGQDFVLSTPTSNSSFYVQGLSRRIGSPPTTAVTLPASESLAATVTLDASGITPGDYTLTFLNSTGYGVVRGTPINPQLETGTLTVIPEPGAYALVTVLGLALIVLIRRKARRAAAANRWLLFSEDC